jgi:hypothetical protein
MKRTVAIAVIPAAVLFIVAVPRARGQCNPTCQGDFNLDGRATIDEIITSVNNALSGCGATPEQQGCIDSGGTASTALCCSTAPDFPDTCGIGSCGCSPEFSREVNICECGAGACFNREQRACVPR